MSDPIYSYSNPILAAMSELLAISNTDPLSEDSLKHMRLAFKHMHEASKKMRQLESKVRQYQIQLAGGRKEQ